MDDLAGALGKKTRLLAIGAASNALGTKSDVRRAADLAHAAGALVFVDAVHYAPHAFVDVAALGADFLACSAYKFYGPARGRPLGTPGPARGARPAQAGAGPRERPGPARDGHAEPRGHRGRGGGRGLPRLAGGGPGPSDPPRRGDGGAPRAGPASRGGAVERAARDRRRHALRPAADGAADADGRVHRARAGPRRTWRGPSPIAPCSSRTATSTPPRSSAGSATPRTASCARAAPATRRSTR